MFFPTFIEICKCLFLISIYKQELESALRLKTPIVINDLENSISNDGELNTRRPLTIQGGMLKCCAIGQKDDNIGRAVTDVTIYPENDEPLYLSLKYGSTVTFINVGIRKELPVQAIMDNAPQNFTQKGKMLLDLFGIDTDKYQEYLDYYKDLLKTETGFEYNDRFTRPEDLAVRALAAI